MCFHRVSGHWKLRAGGDPCNGVDGGDKVENLEVKYEVMEGSIFFSESLWAWKKIGIVGYWATSISTVRSTLFSKKSDRYGFISGFGYLVFASK